MTVGRGEAEAHGEDGQGQGEQPSEDEKDRPYGETARQEEKRVSVTSETLLFFLKLLNSEHKNSPQLSVLIAEVDQTGDVEEKLDKVMTH